MTKTGHFDKAARQADHVHADAEQIQRSYRTLLDGIIHVFDEQRVRGIDVLQHVGIRLAVLVVVFGFIPEALNAMFSLWSLRPLVLLSTVGTAGLVWQGLVTHKQMRQLRTLGSQPFRRRHQQLRAFLADCATERLTRIRDADWKTVEAATDTERAWDEFFARWNTLDLDLAYECAGLLDALARDEDAQIAGGATPHRFKRLEEEDLEDLQDLGRRVERWALKALLVSERPREFWRFPLPRLTFLYRFSPMMGSELPPDPDETREAHVVSDADFRFTIGSQCSGRPEQIDQISRWAEHQLARSRSARSFVRALDEVGLRAGMTRRDFDDMLNAMREQLRQT